MDDAFIDALERIDNNRRGQVVADLTAFTFLIDAGIATIDEICERLELVQSSFGERYQTDQAKHRTLLLTEWLRAHKKTDAPDAPRWNPEVIEGGKDQD